MLDSARSAFSQHQEAASRDALLSRLTSREAQVLERIVAGRLNKQIADDLGHQHQDGRGAPRQHHGKAQRQHGGRPAQDRARRAGQGLSLRTHAGPLRSGLCRYGGVPMNVPAHMGQGSLLSAPCGHSLCVSLLCGRGRGSALVPCGVPQATRQRCPQEGASGRRSAARSLGRREAQGSWPRAKRESSTDSSQLSERSERSERSEFCDGAARPSIAGQSARSADRPSQALRAARTRLCRTDVHAQSGRFNGRQWAECRPSYLISISRRRARQARWSP